MKVKMTLSANAGLSLEFNSAKIWIDALHDNKAPWYSTLTTERLIKMRECEAFRNPDAILFTHRHFDHFSASLVQEAMREWPNARVFAPCVGIEGSDREAEDSDRLRGLDMRELTGVEIITAAREEKWIGGVRISFVKLAHMGDHYASVPHYGILLEEDGFTALFTGDTALGNKDLQRICEERKIDLALLPFPWNTLRVGRDFVNKYIQPEHLVLLHLPFKEDDLEGYRQATEESVSKYRDCPDLRILSEFLQSETIE